MSFPFALPKRVTVVEVGPRDGLQNEAVRVSLDDKVSFVDLLSGAGAPVIEIAAWVRADWVPQMADSGLVAQRIARRSGVHYTGLVPNLRGLEAARRFGTRPV